MESLPEIGDVIDGTYELVSVLGTGGFGAVYRARQLNMDRDVALKMLVASGPKLKEMIKRFRREVMAIRNLTHPNTVRVYDFHDDPDGLLYYTMEALEGHTLKAEVDERGPMSPRRLRRILRQVLKSLSEAHSYGIVHRDLKPANIMLVDMHGEDDFVKVLDFGIAKMLDDRGEDGEQIEQLTSDGILVGTLRYMAPEQIAGEKLGAHTDLYALGLIALEMLTGQSVFAGTGRWEVLQQQISDEPVEIPEPAWNSGLGPVIARCLRKNRDRRFGEAKSALEMLNTIDEEALDDRPLFIRDVDGEIRPRPDDGHQQRATVPIEDSDEEAFEALKTQVMDSTPGDDKTEVVDRPPQLDGSDEPPGEHTEISESPFGDASATLEMDSVAEEVDEQSEELDVTPVDAQSGDELNEERAGGGPDRASEPAAEPRPMTPDETGLSAEDIQTSSEPGGDDEPLSWEDSADDDGSGSTVVVAVAVVAVVIGAVGIWQFIGDDDVDDEDPYGDAVVQQEESPPEVAAEEVEPQAADEVESQVDESEEEDDESPHEVELALENDDVEAAVIVDGEEVGQTPHTLNIEEEFELLVDAEGYEPLEARVNEQTPSEVEVELQPVDDGDESDASDDEAIAERDDGESDESATGAPSRPSGGSPTSEETPEPTPEPVDEQPGDDEDSAGDDDDKDAEDEPDSDMESDDDGDDGWVDITDSDDEDDSDEPPAQESDDGDGEDVPLF